MKPSRIRTNLLQIAATMAVMLALPPGNSGTDKTVVLSIYTNNIGMVSPSGKRLYAVVTSSGEMTYADKTKKGIVTRKRTLSPSELSKLNNVLRNGALGAIKGFQFDKTRTHVDYSIVVEVAITRDSERQEFTLSNYDEDAGRNFAPAAEELLCIVDELRASAYRLTQACSK